MDGKEKQLKFIEKRLKILNQQLVLMNLYPKSFEENIGSQKNINAYIDEILDEILILRKEKRKYEEQ